MPRYAAVDIGSNSVRMLAAEAVPGSMPRVLAADREVTRLGASVFGSGRISEEAMELVSSVLQRFAAAYQKLDVIGVRAVATSAVRDASNQREFISRASEALRTPVEIISGPEEARLIHAGVQSRWPHPKQRVLIIDVGGGSAELIVGDAGEMKEGLSRPLGAVRLTEVFLKSDPPTDTEIRRMQRFIDERLQPAVKRIGDGRFDRVVATSATAAALVSAVNEVRRADREAADRMRASQAQIRALFAELSTRNLNGRRKIPGIGPRRAEIIIGGAAVFLRVMETFKLRSLYYSTAGVRDGIIADLSARGVGQEITRLLPQQLRVVEAMDSKYGIGTRNPKQVARLAHQLFVSFVPLHGLPLEYGRILQAAAYLHNVGHYISDTGHHKHSAYIVNHSDMPGFDNRERTLIALLCRFHRKSMPSPRHDEYQRLSADERNAVLRLTPLLRLAAALDVSQEQKVEDIECQHAAGAASIQVRARGDVDLELWAAERAGEHFRQVYSVPLTIARVRRA